MFRKLNTQAEGDLEFFMLLKGNLFQNLNFFERIHKKLYKINIFLLKSQRFTSSVVFNVIKMVYLLVHDLSV